MRRSQTFRQEDARISLNKPSDAARRGKLRSPHPSLTDMAEAAAWAQGPALTSYSAIWSREQAISGSLGNQERVLANNVSSTGFIDAFNDQRIVTGSEEI
jgi:hypothetical protein